MDLKQRKALKISCIALGVILVLMLGWTLFDRYVDRSGWVEKDGIYSYRDFHGRKVTGWLELDSGKYFFDENHAMVTGWQEIGDNRYYFNSVGAMTTGWKTIEDKHCYFGTDGILHTGWLELDGKTYYLEEDGNMVSGWLHLCDNTHYFGEDGAMLLGWQQLEGKTYYFGDKGIMYHGYVLMEDGQYYFLEDGTLFTGWEDTADGRRYYAPHGPMAVGWTEVEDKLYLFNESGIMQTGWQQLGEYRFYLHEDGHAAVGPTEIDGQLYHFTPKGIQVVLVNADHKVPSYYKPTLVTFTGWHQVAEVALEPLTRMIDDLLAAGYEYEFNSAYRSIANQTDILVLRTKEYEDAGDTREEAYAKARESVALPGTSEHHLGLAVDLLNNKKAEKKALDWLGEHCWEYGFILRYAQEKSHITGIIYEPWHFRYVGTEVSLDMKDSGLCLEEYLGAAPVMDNTIGFSDD